ncbi:hypothetical protein IQ07DRAFT_114766 [Pyrenochaeta sp. DS3sAY3a]|nr:hypothetical protein IQ07DRAFT_114766 [Pyrenochaeta sp. DS3sAY3a]
MAGSDWKHRFNKKQLERKRLSDKISQRRTRQQSKRTIAELECRLRLARDGHVATLINRMQQENALLRTKIWRYRFQMETMFIQSKECLLHDDDSWSDLNAPILIPKPPNLNDTIHPPEPLIPSTPDAQVERKCLARLFKIQPSLFVELAGLMGSTNDVDGQVAANNLLESIMMWKAKFAFVKNEFAVLIASLNLDQEPFYLTSEKVHEQALSRYVYQDILQNLLYGEEIAPRDLRPDDKIPEEQMSKMQYQRRAIAYCAYETVWAWRECFKSSLEYAASFWAQYRYFMLIAFPTIENYHKCPSWRRPIATQFNHDHPSILDLIIWPKLRAKLVLTWQQYELPALCLSLAQSFEFTGKQVDIATAIRLQADSSDLILEESFERAVHDLQNFTAAGAPFTAQYPELGNMTVLEFKPLQCLGSPLLDQSCVASYNYFGHQNQLSSEENVQTSPDASSEQQSEDLDSALLSIDLPDLVIDSSTDISGSLGFDWYTESLQDQEFEAISRQFGEKGHPGGSFVDVSPFTNMIGLGNIEHGWT